MPRAATRNSARWAEFRVGEVSSNDAGRQHDLRQGWLCAAGVHRIVIRHSSDCACAADIRGTVPVAVADVILAGTAPLLSQWAAPVPDVAETVAMLIGGHFGIDPALVLLHASLFDDLGADSLDRVELVIAFEEAFRITIPDSDLERIRTVYDAVEYIRLRTVSD